MQHMWGYVNPRQIAGLERPLQRGNRNTRNVEAASLSRSPTTLPLEAAPAAGDIRASRIEVRKGCMIVYNT